MKYEGKRPSRIDSQMNVYQFVFGVEEIDALRKVLKDFRERCPKITETQILRARIGSILAEFSRFETYKRMDSRSEGYKPTELEMERVEKNQCTKCGTPLVPDSEAVMFGTRDWDKHSFKFNCDCYPDKDIRVCIG